METKRLFAAIKVEPEEAFSDMYHNLCQVLGFHIIKWVEPITSMLPCDFSVKPRLMKSP